MLTQERLKELLHYDPETGVWRWIKITHPSGRTKVGSIAGTPYTRGYRRIIVDGKKYRSARLAVLYMTGKWPPDGVDHRDGDTSNDRWTNLRCATQSQNGGNMRRPVTNTSGFKGAVLSKGKYTARIRVNQKRISLGVFATAAEAHAAYVAAAQKEFGEFARSA